MALLFSASTPLDSQKGENYICKMGVFYIRVSTGCSLYAGSIDKVHLWLVGEHGEASLGMLLAPQRNSVSFTELRLGWCGGVLGGGGQGQRNPKEPCAGSLAPRKALTALGSKAHAERHSVGLSSCWRPPGGDSPVRLSFHRTPLDNYQ